MPARRGVWNFERGDPVTTIIRCRRRRWRGVVATGRARGRDRRDGAAGRGSSRVPRADRRARRRGERAGRRRHPASHSRVSTGLGAFVPSARSVETQHGETAFEISRFVTSPRGTQEHGRLPTKRRRPRLSAGEPLSHGRTYFFRETREPPPCDAMWNPFACCCGESEDARRAREEEELLQATRAARGGGGGGGPAARVRRQRRGSGGAEIAAEDAAAGGDGG